MPRRLLIVSLVAIGAATLAGRCASVPAAKQVAVASEQAFHRALVAFDDAEQTACQPAPAQVSHCQSAAVPDRVHQQVSVAVSRLYTQNIKLSQALVVWAHGGPVPTELAALVQQVATLRDLVVTLGGALLEHAKTLLAQAQTLVDAVR